MRARILLLISAFALLPGCKKAPAPEPPTPEQISAAEEEIIQIAKKVCYATIFLEQTKGAGEAMVRKEELDELKSRLLAARESNKDKIPLDQSQELADRTIEDAKIQREKDMREIKATYQADLREIEEETRTRNRKEIEERERRRGTGNPEGPFVLPK